MEKIIRVLMAIIIPAFLAGGPPAEAAYNLGLNFTGTQLTDLSPRLIPPDTMGAVGPSHIVEFTNGRFAIFNKTTGSLISSQNFTQFWQSANVSIGDGCDPRIVHDQASSRWFASGIDLDDDPGNHFLLAVSRTSDPTAGWNGFKLPYNVSNSTFVDFDTLGVDADGVYLASNNFTSSLVNVDIISIPKADLLLATPTVARATAFEARSLSQYGFSLQPALDFGASDGRAAILAVDYDTEGNLNRANVLNAGAASASLSSAANIDVADWLAPPDARQLGSTRTIETNDDRFSGYVYEVGDSLWAAHTIGVDDTGEGVADRDAIRWYQISESTNTVLQYGTIGDTTHDYYYPSIAANTYGDVVIGFTRSGPSEYASAYAAVGQTVSNVTTFAAPQLLKAGTASYYLTYSGTRNRWGDYSATMVDPSNPRTFWTFQEWATSPSNTWATQITQINITSGAQKEIADIWNTGNEVNFYTIVNGWLGTTFSSSQYICDNYQALETLPTGNYRITKYAKYAGFTQTVGYYPQGNTGSTTFLLFQGNNGNFSSNISLQPGFTFGAYDTPSGAGTKYTELVYNPGSPSQSNGLIFQIGSNYIVTFEDLTGLGDKDYNDLVFLLAPVTTAAEAAAAYGVGGSGAGAAELWEVVEGVMGRVETLGETINPAKTADLSQAAAASQALWTAYWSQAPNLFEDK